MLLSWAKSFKHISIGLNKGNEEVVWVQLRSGVRLSVCFYWLPKHCSQSVDLGMAS